ncbi:DUF2809 domain-containing protein [Agromyces bauzanensis]
MPLPIAPAPRVRALAAAATSLALGLGLQLLDRSLAVDLAGSVLYVVFLGLLMLVVMPSLPALVVGPAAFATAAAIELLQLTEVPQAIVDAVPPARLVFGSAFDPLDLVGYAAGAVVLVVVKRLIARSTRRDAGLHPRVARAVDAEVPGRTLGVVALRGDELAAEEDRAREE